MSASSNTRKAVVAPQAVLTEHGVEVVSNEGHGEEVQYRQWKFKSKHHHMLDSSEMNKLAEDIAATIGGTTSSEDHVVISGHTLRLPAMVFGKDVFEMAYHSPSTTTTTTINDSPSSVIISLNALDALSCWAAQHSIENKESVPLRIIQVPYAKSWVNKHPDVVAVSTPTTAPTTTTTTTTTIESSSTVQHTREDEKHSNYHHGTVSNSIIAPIQNIWDWTFSSDYCCTVGINGKANEGRSSDTVISAHALSSETTLLQRLQNVNLNTANVVPSSSHVSRIWNKTDVSGINYDMLRMRDVPILFYDEVLLYQDDLEDCGDVLYEAKLRVMPQCWFLLSRFFLRVDGSVVRIRDTRIFHRFGDTQIHMDVSWKEQSLVSTTGIQDGLPPVPSSSSSPSLTSSTAGPIRLNSPPQPSTLSSSILRNPAQLAEILPFVNKEEGVHRFFVMNL